MTAKPQQTNLSRYEVRFSGSGGQGLITAAVLFAEAVGVFGVNMFARPKVTGQRPGEVRARLELL